MEHDGSSVTLIFYRVGERWWKEPLLNIVAAVAQFSSLTHVEIAIGEDAGSNGTMANVCRVFNDNIGVVSEKSPLSLRARCAESTNIVVAQELVERTGRNPCYTYLQLGCSKPAAKKMLHFAKTKCVGKPFSNMGMARSLLWPRSTDTSSFFCAELVAAILKEGGLMEQSSNPGSATPELLHRLYKDRAAATANPYVLRDMQTKSNLSFHSTVGNARVAAERESLLNTKSSQSSVAQPQQRIGTSAQHQLGERRRAESPPRGHFRCVSSTPSFSWHDSTRQTKTGLTITLNSLDMRRFGKS